MITVSLENSRRIRVARQTGDLSVDDSNVDKYAGRENFVNVLGGDIMDMNLDEFFKVFELNSLAVPKRRQDSRNIVLRVLQGYSPNPNNPTYPLYCKYRLIQFKPWRLQLDANLFNHGDNENGWVRAWKEFIESDLGQVIASLI